MGGLPRMSNLEVPALVELFLCWILWVRPFLLRRKQKREEQPAVTAPAARWGIGLQAVAFFLAWLRTVRFSPPPLLIASMLVAPAATFLVWQAVKHLGKQWRIQAGLYNDHELIRTGPYAVVRHPIYASMFGMFLATGLIMARWPILLIATALFLAGTEIRVHVEDRLPFRGRFSPIPHDRARLHPLPPVKRSPGHCIGRASRFLGFHRAT